MSNPKSAEWYRAQNTDISGSHALAAGAGDATLVTGKTGWTIYIQYLEMTIETDAAQTARFEDSNGSPKFVAITDASPGVGTIYSWDFGAKGLPLTEAKNFLLNVSAAGLAAHIEWSGYMAQTAREYLRGAGTIGTGQIFA